MAAALRARAGVGRVVRRLPLRVLLGLHPPVLEPDLDLALGEAQRVGDLDPAAPREIVVEVELLLELEGLEPGVGLPPPPPRAAVGTFDN